MKKILSFIFILLIYFGVSAQSDFKTQISTAKSSYTGGKLEDTHFALQQALSEIDMTIGKEILKLLPEKMAMAAVNPKEDHVTSNLGLAGATVHRSYGDNPALVEFELISNSPLVSTLNMFLNTPLMGGMMRDENTKTIKVQGYKARLEKQNGSIENEFNYQVQIPFGNALLTFTANKSTENDAIKLINTLPLQQIAKLVQ
ncbi:MAG: hypothetical protein GC171_03255 [Terrimonas sp.]|nr:hypothetical protein [Terrimonas sp.]